MGLFKGSTLQRSYSVHFFSLNNKHSLQPENLWLALNWPLSQHTESGKPIRRNAIRMAECFRNSVREILRRA